MMAAIAGNEVLDEDFNTGRIKIAFNPLETDPSKQFVAAQDTSYQNNARWIPDISEIFKSEFDSFNFVIEYCKNNPEITPSELSKIINQLKSIANRQIGVIELASHLDIDVVTEIFIRINSQGKALSQSDFAMSKIATDEKYGGNMLRKAIDYFCHLAVKPEFYSIMVKDKAFMSTEYADKLKWLKNDKESIYDPDYGDMIRVAFMHKFNKSRLSELVSLLSGHDFLKKEYKDEVVEDSFAKLKAGVLNYMNEYNFSQFVLTIKGAGFISEKLISSQMTLDFAYTLYLLLLEDKTIPKRKCLNVLLQLEAFPYFFGKFNI